MQRRTTSPSRGLGGRLQGTAGGVARPGVSRPSAVVRELHKNDGTNPRGARGRQIASEMESLMEDVYGGAVTQRPPPHQERVASTHGLRRHSTHLACREAGKAALWMQLVAALMPAIEICFAWMFILGINCAWWALRIMDSKFLISRQGKKRKIFTPKIMGTPSG
ncbi:hypothetical protein TcCL_ESM04963 [Trypanosoma cruzi]|nr:hypothetical protein TcCL_ESM04963 [Trypanosoma cruzi]